MKSINALHPPRAERTNAVHNYEGAVLYFSVSHHTSVSFGDTEKYVLFFFVFVNRGRIVFPMTRKYAQFICVPRINRDHLQVLTIVLNIREIVSREKESHALCDATISR